MTNILIIDDDDQLRISFERLLKEEGYGVCTAASGEAGVRMINQVMPDLVMLDLRLPGMNGLETFKQIHGMEPKLPVIIMTAFGTTETAIEATKRGAYDYVVKPFDIPQMLSTIHHALEAGRFMRSPVHMGVAPEKTQGEAIIGKSPAMQEVYKSIGRVSATDATVLIRGESGSGKELVARALYQHSLRAEKPFLVINCVAIPDTLLESELFGYEKGAFTGATHRRVGKIEQAGGGTVFLDEIGDMPMNLQAKMLRLLQEKSVERLGGRETLPVDVRIIAATNRDLEDLIAMGQFREDLYYRLKVITIWLPALDERTGDIPLLVDYFLTRFAAELGVENPGIAREALSMMVSNPWPGNIRELSNTLQKALIFNRGAPLSISDITNATCGDAKSHHVKEVGGDDSIRAWLRSLLSKGAQENLFENCMDHFCGMLVGEALNLTGGNRSQAAKLLGMSRPTLHAKIDKYNLKIETSIK
ncbi:sigma-54-dependent transcriptional regulator [Desulfosarcina sp.]|uniref:sigma-54-dependent transcriptional regulator n=1 Tax=Desulfosarcina sp. TaxID=2027861 RepID=UPI0039711289